MTLPKCFSGVSVSAVGPTTGAIPTAKENGGTVFPLRDVCSRWHQESHCKEEGIGDEVEQVEPRSQHQSL